MTLDELSEIVGRARWFAHLGKFREREDAVPLATVASSAAWEWLPTSRDQPDPIHGRSLVDLSERGGQAEARRKAELSIARATLVSLRSVPDSHPDLADGPDNLTLAAKGGALYAVRMAAREIVAGRPGFWCGVVREYEQGFWPCGIFDDGQRLVVY